MNYFFRNIKDDELSIAYDLHCELVEQMLQKGIRQWLRPIDKQKLIERQSRGENYGLFDENNELKVFLSLVKRSEYYEWSNWISSNSTIWLNTVSVNVHNKEKGLGKKAILYAIKFLKDNSINELYLDCVINDGFLIKYYTELGFEKIGETHAKYKSGEFLVALMKRKIE